MRSPQVLAIRPVDAATIDFEGTDIRVPQVRKKIASEIRLYSERRGGGDGGGGGGGGGGEGENAVAASGRGGAKEEAHSNGAAAGSESREREAPADGGADERRVRPRRDSKE